MIYKMADSVDVSDHALVEKYCKVCKRSAKSGMICSKCGVLYHSSCGLRAKKCCGIVLQPRDDFQVIEDMEDCSKESFTVLKLLLLEMRQTNSLLNDKVNLLQSQLKAKDSEIDELKSVYNKVANQYKKPDSNKLIDKDKEVNNKKEMPKEKPEGKQTKPTDNIGKPPTLITKELVQDALDKVVLNPPNTDQQTGAGFVEVKYKKREGM